MEFQIWPLKVEAAGGKSQRKFGGVHAMKWLLVADSVEKVENRGAPKISQMSVFGLLRRYVAF
jgi:hypothetical protein